MRVRGIQAHCMSSITHYKFFAGNYFAKHESQCMAGCTLLPG